MTLAEMLTLSLVAALLVMSPGPNGVLIAKTVPTSGRTAAFANVAGFVAAFYLHGALSILGMSILLVQSSLAFSIVKYAGAAYLIWIGIKNLRAALRGGVQGGVEPAKRKRKLRAAFVEGFLANALNPKVSMFYLAAFPQFIDPAQAGAGAAFLLVFLHSLINAVWFGAMVMLFATVTSTAKSPRFQTWLRGITGVVFVGFGLKLATTRAIQ